MYISALCFLFYFLYYISGLHSKVYKINSKTVDGAVG